MQRSKKTGGVRISEMFADDCKWVLEVMDTTYTIDQFKAKVRWYQLVEYETGEGISEMRQLIYSEFHFGFSRNTATMGRTGRFYPSYG